MDNNLLKGCPVSCQAENKPIEPEPGNAGEGKSKEALHYQGFFVSVSYYPIRK